LAQDLEREGLEHESPRSSGVKWDLEFHYRTGKIRLDVLEKSRKVGAMRALIRGKEMRSGE
jgi:hypothetical protein